MVGDHTTRRALLGGLAGGLALGAGCLDGDEEDEDTPRTTNATETTVASNATVETVRETTEPRPPGADRLAAAGTDVDFPTLRYAGSKTGASEDAIELRSQPRRVWSAELPGEAYAPIVNDGMVFVALKQYQRDQPSLYALSAASGRVVWSADLGTSATGPPTIHKTEDTRRLYVGNRQGYLQALNPMTGEEEWRADVSSERAFAPSPRPTDRIVTGGPGQLVELDARSGEKRYERSVEGEIDAVPATTDSRVVLLTRPVDGNREVVAVNPLADREDWRSSSVFAGAHPPVVRNGLVYVSNARGVEARDIATGAEQWTARTSTDAPPAVTSSTVVVRGASEVIALDASRGREQWRRPVGYAEEPPAPTIGGSVVYAGGYDTHRECMALDVNSGSILWTTALDSGWATEPPVPVDAGLIQSTGGHAEKPYQIHAFTDWD